MRTPRQVLIVFAAKPHDQRHQNDYGCRRIDAVVRNPICRVPQLPKEMLISQL
jgi:hypothetical protein